MVFAPLPNEINVTPAAMVALESGKRVTVPRIDWNARTLTPALVLDWLGDLMPDRFGTRAPRPDLPTVPLEEIDAALIPALACTRRGERLGRGAGFYDRFLARSGFRAASIGVIFSAQLADQLPREPHDRALDWVVTDRDTLHVAAT